MYDLRYRMSFGNTPTVTLFFSHLTDKRGDTGTVVQAHGVGEGLVRPRNSGVTARWNR